MGIYKKIAEARVKFSSLSIKKSGNNKFAGYDYFELSDILPSALRICAEVGIAPVISFEEGYAVMTVYDTDDDSTVVIKSPLAEATLKGCHPIQNMGAVETYSRRYLWFSLFEITEPDALDATQGKDDSPALRKAERTAKPNANDSKVHGAPDYSASTVWSRLMRHYGYDTSMKESMENQIAKDKSLEFLKPYGCSSGKDITPEIGKAIMDRLDNMEMLDNPESTPAEEIA